MYFWVLIYLSKTKEDRCIDFNLCLLKFRISTFNELKSLNLNFLLSESVAGNFLYKVKQQSIIFNN